jgi:hypothetical protein
VSQGNYLELLTPLHPFNDIGYELFLGKEAPKLLHRIVEFANDLKKKGIAATFFFDPASTNPALHKVSNEERKL